MHATTIRGSCHARHNSYILKIWLSNLGCSNGDTRVLFAGSQDHTALGSSSGSDRFFGGVLISYISEALTLELSVFSDGVSRY